MNEKNLKFIVISTLTSTLSLALLLGSYLVNSPKKTIIILIALSLLIILKISEFILIKKTRKISVATLLLLVAVIIYILTK